MPEEKKDIMLEEKKDIMLEENKKDITPAFEEEEYSEIDLEDERTDLRDTLYDLTPDGEMALRSMGKFTLTETTSDERMDFRSKRGNDSTVSFGPISIDIKSITIKSMARSITKTTVRSWEEVNTNFDAILGSLSYGMAMTAIYLFTFNDPRFMWVGWLLLFISLVLVKAKHIPRQGWIIDLLKRDTGKAAEKIEGIKGRVETTINRLFK